MSKFVICRGLPGSGKSTWAREEVTNDYNGVIRCNRDDIRKMLHDSVWKGQETESVVIMMRDAMIRAAMKARKPLVISDDTNLDPRVVKQIAKIATFFGYEVEVRDFDTPLKVCIERDAQRQGVERVGEDVIREMHRKFFKSGKFPENPLGKMEAVTFEPYVADISLPDAVIFDADGTLFSHEGVRSPYDYTRVHLDSVREKVARMAKMHYDHGDEIIIASGREDICREATAEAVRKIVPEFHLFMRPAGDKRQDRVIKGELFDKYIRNNFNVHCVYDDRTQVVDLWRNELGLDCFQVNYGDF
jgi:predicted kinase